jgi:hypothetical protein
LQPWRNDVTKAVILMGDAPGKDPEPHTGFTLANIAAHAAALDPVQIYPILVGSDPSAHTFDSALADATSGTVFDATSDPSAAGPAFVDAVQAITGRQATLAQLAVASTAVAGLPKQLTAHVTPGTGPWGRHSHLHRQRRTDRRLHRRARDHER